MQGNNEEEIVSGERGGVAGGGKHGWDPGLMQSLQGEREEGGVRNNFKMGKKRYFMRNQRGEQQYRQETTA